MCSCVRQTGKTQIFWAAICSLKTKSFFLFAQFVRYPLQCSKNVICTLRFFFYFFEYFISVFENFHAKITNGTEILLKRREKISFYIFYILNKKKSKINSWFLCGNVFNLLLFVISRAPPVIIVILCNRWSGDGFFPNRNFFSLNVACKRLQMVCTSYQRYRNQKQLMFEFVIFTRFLLISRNSKQIKVAVDRRGKKLLCNYFWINFFQSSIGSEIKQQEKNCRAWI